MLGCRIKQWDLWTRQVLFFFELPEEQVVRENFFLIDRSTEDSNSYAQTSSRRRKAGEATVT
jgi:hypothetical protein